MATCPRTHIYTHSYTNIPPRAGVQTLKCSINMGSCAEEYGVMTSDTYTNKTHRAGVQLVVHTSIIKDALSILNITHTISHTKKAIIMLCIRGHSWRVAVQ